MKTPIRFRAIFTILGVTTALCLVSPAIVGIAAAALSYDGNCYGFTDGVTPCSWWQFAQSQMFYGLLIAFAPAMFLLMGWLSTGGLWLALRRQSARSKLPAWQAIFIPLAAFATGILLIYVIPFLTGWR